MKKTLLALLIVAGCSTAQATETSLAPLPTTGLSNSPVVQSSYLTSVQQYFDLYYHDGGYIYYPDDILVSYAMDWCDAMRQGMTAQDVTDRINEGALDQNDANVHMAIVYAAVDNYCPDQKRKWP